METCANTYYLNKHLAEQDDLESRAEYVAEIAEGLEANILMEAKSRDLVAEAMIESDEHDDIKLIMQIIIEDASDSDFKMDDIFTDYKVRDIISEGVENCYIEFSYILQRESFMPLSCQIFIVDYVGKVAGDLAEEQVAKMEADGPDDDGLDSDED